MCICWCGNNSFADFNSDYGECQSCGTLVYLKEMTSAQLEVSDDESDFYGKKYWLEHQQEAFGYADIYARARNDLTERNLHWLKTLLKYRLPPAKVLEIGCTHGSFVALLHQAGYDASGVEMSPWVVQFGQETFGVPISVGPVENLDISPGSLDVIVLMDVLEHLSDPIGTMGHCLRLLKPEGLLLIQTPQFKKGMNYDVLVESKGAFLEQLKSDEHLYLFTDHSATRLFQQLGADHVQFEPAIFGHYDMFFAVSRLPFETHTAEVIGSTLSGSPHARLVLALLDIYAREQDLSKRMEVSETDRFARWEQIQTLTSRVKELEERIDVSETDRFARWQQIQELTSRIKEFEEMLSCKNQESQLKAIAVDLTPILPGGENGGAKIFVLDLIRKIASMKPQTQFILLTQAASHSELSHLDSNNISRKMIVGLTGSNSICSGIRRFASKLLPRVPFRFRKLISTIGYYLYSQIRTNESVSLLKNLNIDLLFCPFTAPTYYNPSIPTVSTIYDLQYKTYPEFFAPEDVAHRDQAFLDACRRSTMLTAISEYSRGKALSRGDIEPDRIRTIYLRMAQRIVANPGENSELLRRFGLVAGGYVIYPANFWRHKNHEMLLTAFGIALKRGLPKDFKLVCTGAPGERQLFLVRAAQTMGLGDNVVFPGFLPSEELSALLVDARGMIFPSLYEGFGLPVIEAMAAGVPVACSNITSLPEVAAEAAMLFDPRVPDQIASALVTLATDESVKNDLVRAGHQRASEFVDTERMAQEYWDLFLQAVDKEPCHNLLIGVHADGWVGREIVLKLSPVSAPQTLELSLSMPEWHPALKVKISATLNGKMAGEVFEISRGTFGTLVFPLEQGSKSLTLQFDTSFVPEHCGLGSDSRDLSVLVEKAELVAANGERVVL